MINRVNISMNDENLSRLDEVATAYGMNRSAWIALKVNQEYDALHGNDELKNTLITLNEIKRLVGTLNINTGD